MAVSNPVLRVNPYRWSEEIKIVMSVDGAPDITRDHANPIVPTGLEITYRADNHEPTGWRVSWTLAGRVRKKNGTLGIKYDRVHSFAYDADTVPGWVARVIADNHPRANRMFNEEHREYPGGLLHNAEELKTWQALMRAH